MRKVKWLSLVTSLALMLLPRPVSADVLLENQMSASFGSGVAGHRFFAYGSGSSETLDWVAGSVTGPAVVTDNTLSLDADWWDADWKSRQCGTVTATEFTSGTPVRLVVDTSSTPVGVEGEDVRVVLDDGTVVDSWSEGPFPDSESVVWAKLDAVPADLCVYWNNANAASVSDWSTVFSYDSQVLRYFTLFDTSNDLRVLSYVDGNDVTVGGVTVTLNAGDTWTFTGIDEDTVVLSSGPIEAVGAGASRETVTPELYASSQFTFPTNRYNERFWVRAIDATVNIDVVLSGNTVQAVTVTPADGAVQILENAPTNRYISLVGDGDFVAVQSGTNDQDAFTGVPWYGDDLYGVANRQIRAGSHLSGTATATFADGATANVALGPLVEFGQTRGGGLGNGMGARVTSPIYAAAISQADNDGTESTSFLPERLLSTQYRIPVGGRYWSLACPIPGTLISVNGAAPVSCAGTDVGDLRSAGNSFAAGTVLEGDHPFYAMYETSSDEHQLLGFKGGMPLTDASFAAGVVENQEVCGVWESTGVMVTGVAGLFEAATVTPPPSSVVFELSIDGGVSWQSVSSGDYLPYAADDGTVLVRATLCTTDLSAVPVVESISVESGLVEFFDGDTVVSSGSDWALRVYYDGLAVDTGWADVVASSGDAVGTIGTDHPVSIGSWSGASPISTLSTWTGSGPFSVSFDVTSAPTVTSSVTLRFFADQGVAVSSGVVVELA